MSQLILTILLIALSAVACNTDKAIVPEPPYTTPLMVGGTNLFVEVVSTPESWQMGLSNREPLKANQGMLFNFKNHPNTIRSFWMKDMKFDLDIIWINDSKIIGVSKNALSPQPQTKDQDLPLYNSPGPADHVLEIRSGRYDELGLKIGDPVKLSN